MCLLLDHHSVCGNDFEDRVGSVGWVGFFVFSSSNLLLIFCNIALISSSVFKLTQKVRNMCFAQAALPDDASDIKGMRNELSPHRGLPQVVTIR